MGKDDELLLHLLSMRLRLPRLADVTRAKSLMYVRLGICVPSPFGTRGVEISLGMDQTLRPSAERMIARRDI